jgi:hypothetical protein
MHIILQHFSMLIPIKQINFIRSETAMDEMFENCIENVGLDSKAKLQLKSILGSKILKKT